MKNATGAAVPVVTEPEFPGPAALLRYVRLVGYGLLVIELICFWSWSALLYHRSSLTFDFAIYHQGWYLIAHGNLDPFNSLQGHPFWQDHSEFIMWPLALLYWIPPHDLILLWVQDAGVVVAQTVTFTWMCELAQKYRPGKEDAAVLAGAGLVLLIANPWTWKSISFDYHMEPVAVAFLALLARDFANGRRRAWVWVVPLLACGDVAASYVTAVGIGGILAARRTRLPGLGLCVIGVAALEVIRLVHGDRSSPFWAFLYLEYPPNAPFSIGAVANGMAHNPRLVVRQLWHNTELAWENLSPSGGLGVGFIWLLPTVLLVLLTNSLLQGNLFAQPGFQSLPLYILVPVGTIAVLGWMSTRWYLVAGVLTFVVLAQALYWPAVYGPQTKSQWLRVSAPAAATLSRVASRIPASDEVIASQGVVGRFSSRTDVQAFFGPNSDLVPLSGGRTWFIVVPNQGIETTTPQEGMQLIQKLAGPMHASLVTHANGVWVYQWTPPRGQHKIILP